MRWFPTNGPDANAKSLKAADSQSKALAMKLSDFDFDLPEGRIATRPARPRSSAKLLVAGPGTLHDQIVRDLPDWLRPGELLVLNDTKVIPAQLEGRRQRGDASAGVSVTLHMRCAPDQWRAFARPAKKLQIDDQIEFERAGERLTASVEE